MRENRGKGEGAEMDEGGVGGIDELFCSSDKRSALFSSQQRRALARSDRLGGGLIAMEESSGPARCRRQVGLGVQQLANNHCW